MKNSRKYALLLAGALLVSQVLSGCYVADAYRYVFRNVGKSESQESSEESTAHESSAPETETASGNDSETEEQGAADSGQGTAVTDSGFTEFTDEVVGELLGGNTLNVHYYIYDGSRFGVDTYEASWGNADVSEEAQEEYRAEMEDLKSRLEEFDYDSLGWEERLTYDTLENYIALELSSIGLELYQEPLSGSNGIQSALPVELAEYNFYTAEDAETYLELCRQLPDYFDELLAFEQEKADAGLFMEDDVLDDVVDQCRTFAEGKENSFLYSSFEERIDALDLTETEKEELIEENSEAVDAVYTAYTDLADGMEALRGSGKYQGGLCNYPDGTAYYEYLIETSTGSSKSPDEMIQLLSDTIEEDIIELRSLVQDSVTYNNFLNFSYPTTDPNLIMRMLIEACADDYPALDEVDYTINYVDESLRDYLSPAFYLKTPIDADTMNNIYINSEKGSEDEDIFTVLAHEGYPGHLYQSNYFRQNSNIALRQVLSTTGFEEGWAEYVEFKSYSMIDGADQNAAAAMRLNQQIVLCVYGLSDLGIHYEGWNMDDVYEFFSQYFDIDMEDAEWIYTYILGDPGGYLDYIIGDLEIEQLEADYSGTALEFHTEILNLSGAPFDIIEKYMFN